MEIMIQSNDEGIKEVVKNITLFIETQKNSFFVGIPVDKQYEVMEVVKKCFKDGIIDVTPIIDKENFSLN